MGNSIQTDESFLFEQALQIVDPEERRKFLETRCGSDARLRARLEALLQANFESNQPFALDSALPTNSTEIPLIRFGSGVFAEEAPGSIVDRYRLVRQIGQGGFGVVYLADQEVPVRRPVALKVIKAGMDTRQIIARFEQERQVLALLNHPGIAQILDAGATPSGRPYFVMEYVDGPRITQFCDSRCLGLTERLTLFVQVCHAIQHAHQKGIIHRDIKPSNILMASSGPAGDAMPKVIDFGIAKATEGHVAGATIVTEASQFMGTPAYMSPEQADLIGGDIDTRSDIYSLGALLYELLTGRTPFDGATLLGKGLDELRRTIREVDPPRPSTRLQNLMPEELAAIAEARRTEVLRLRSEIHGDLDWIVMKCLEKDRARRYETANGLAMDIGRFLRNEPVLARPPTVGYQMRKFAQRNRGAVVAGISLASSLVLGIALTTWQAVQARTARIAADQNRARAEAGERKAQQLLYSAKIKLAQTAWEEANEGRLAELLADTESSPYRGFEWKYWKRASKQALFVLRQPDTEMLAAEFAPDGRTIATAGQDWVVRLWDANSGLSRGHWLGHAHSVNALAYTPDGRLLASASEDQTVILWDVSSGTIARRLVGHAGEVLCIAINPDGQSLVSAGTDGTVRLWDVATGQTRWVSRTLLDNVYALAFSMDGKLIAMTGHQAPIELLDATTGELVKGMANEAPPAMALAFSPDGVHLVSGHGDGLIRAWHVGRGARVAMYPGASRATRTVSLSPDASLILAGSDDRSLRIWEGATGVQLPVMKGHDGALTAARFSPDGRSLLSASRDGTARVWRAPRLDSVEGMPRHEKQITRVAVSRDNRFMATSSQDHTARVYDRSTGKVLKQLGGHGATVNSVAFLGQGSRLASSGSGGGIWIWIWGGKDWEVERKIEAGGATRYFLANSPDGSRLAGACEDGTGRVWEVDTGKELLVLRGHTARLTGIGYSGDGRWLATSSEDGTARVWDASDGRFIREFTGHKDRVSAVCFFPDGKTIATGSWDRTARIWEVATGSEVRRLRGHSGVVWALDISPNGKRIATAGRDYTVRVWDPSTGDELISLRSTESVNTVVFTADGEDLLVGGADPQPRVWQSARDSEIEEWARMDRKLEEQANSQLYSNRSIRVVDPSKYGELPGVVHRWLAVVPVPLDTNSWHEIIRDMPLVPGESKLAPAPGDSLVVGGTNLVWKSVFAPDGMLDFTGILGKPRVRAVGFGVAYLHSDTVQSNVVIRVGDEDPTQVYLNGTRIHRLTSGHHEFKLDIDAIAGAQLRAGTNVIVVKSFNTGGLWKCTLRVTDENGGPVPGVRELDR